MRSQSGKVHPGDEPPASHHTMRSTLPVTPKGRLVEGAHFPGAVVRLLRVLRATRRDAFQWVALVVRTVRSALDHDVPTVAQATSYAAIFALFPALIVAAAFVATLPHYLPIKWQMAAFFGRVLPSNVRPVLYAYFDTTGRSPQTTRALVGAAVVSLTGGASVMSTLMEGFRRAHGLPYRAGFWRHRLRALLLVPLSLLPMGAASLLVIFGQFITRWLARHLVTDARVPILVLAFALRWAIALAGSVGVIAMIYHLGTDLNRQMREHVREHMQPLLALRMKTDWSWRASLPGAMFATGAWFLATLAFGYYVTRFANYSRVYGSLGAAVALMSWLYIIAFCVLCGAEFNVQLAERRRLRTPNAGGAPGPRPDDTGLADGTPDHG